MGSQRGWHVSLLSTAWWLVGGDAGVVLVEHISCDTWRCSRSVVLATCYLVNFFPHAFDVRLAGLSQVSTAVWCGRFDWPAHLPYPFCQHASVGSSASEEPWEQESCRLVLLRWWRWCVPGRSCRAEIPDICTNGWIPCVCHCNNRTGIAAGSAVTGKTRGHPDFVFRKVRFVFTLLYATFVAPA